MHIFQLIPSFLRSFFFQAILFYIPRWLWKNWEAGKITALMMDLDIGVVSEVEKKQKKKLLLDYLYDNLKNHNWWAYRYFFCELLAFCNIVGESSSARESWAKKGGKSHARIAVLVDKTKKKY